VASQLRILIIDDDPTHLKLYSWILDREGFATNTLLVKQNGFELPRDQQFDLVLLDYKLITGISATELARAMKDCWPGTPIVVLSDMMWMPDDIAPLADDFVHKGDPQELIAKVSELIKHKTSM
jgi:two-component system alkaline phosphatase synthesis response regulator PhoP